MEIEQFRDAAGISGALAEKWFAEMTEAMEEFGIDTRRRQAAFIAQIAHESAGFTRIVESFNYSVEGLISNFGHRLTREQCRNLGRQPGERMVPQKRQEVIANAVYGGRYGNNRNGDGWKYRGRGLKQLTFLDNYRACGIALGLDLVGNPDLLLQEAPAARSAGWFWASNNLSRYADNDNFVGLTVAINGGKNGLEDRTMRWQKAKRVLLA